MKPVLILLILSLSLNAQIKTSGQKTGVSQTNSVGIELVYIEKGEFMMGSPKTEATRYSNEDLHRVTLTKPFFIGKFELTQKQWLSLMKVTPQQLNQKRLDERDLQKEAFNKLSAAEKKAEKNKIAQLKKGFPVKTGKAEKPTDKQKATQKKLRTFGQKQKELAIKEKKDGTNLRFGDNSPMCFTNWTEAMAFCKKLTEQERAKGSIPAGWLYRLPTEAEWEYAARAGTSTPVYNGKQPDFKDEQSMVEFSKHSWINPYSTNRIHKVGLLKPNAWGIHDILGNVTEWCMDIHQPFTSEPQIDPVVTEGPGMLRMYRGLTAHNGPLDIRTARRKVGGPRVPYWGFFGFRVVLAQETDAINKVKDNHSNR